MIYFPLLAVDSYLELGIVAGKISYERQSSKQHLVSVEVRILQPKGEDKLCIAYIAAILQIMTKSQGKGLWKGGNISSKIRIVKHVGQSTGSSENLHVYNKGN